METTKSKKHQGPINPQKVAKVRRHFKKLGEKFKDELKNETPKTTAPYLRYINEVKREICDFRPSMEQADVTTVQNSIPDLKATAIRYPPGSSPPSDEASEEEIQIRGEDEEVSRTHNTPVPLTKSQSLVLSTLIEKVATIHEYHVELANELKVFIKAVDPRNIPWILHACTAPTVQLVMPETKVKPAAVKQSTSATTTTPVLRPEDKKRDEREQRKILTTLPYPARIKTSAHEETRILAAVIYHKVRCMLIDGSMGVETVAKYFGIPFKKFKTILSGARYGARLLTESDVSISSDDEEETADVPTIKSPASASIQALERKKQLKHKEREQLQEMDRETRRLQQKVDELKARKEVSETALETEERQIQADLELAQRIAAEEEAAARSKKSTSKHHKSKTPQQRAKSKSPQPGPSREGSHKKRPTFPTYVIDEDEGEEQSSDTEEEEEGDTAGQEEGVDQEPNFQPFRPLQSELYDDDDDDDDDDEDFEEVPDPPPKSKSRLKRKTTKRKKPRFSSDGDEDEPSRSTAKKRKDTAE